MGSVPSPWAFPRRVENSDTRAQAQGLEGQKQKEADYAYLLAKARPPQGPWTFGVGGRGWGADPGTQGRL